PPPTVIYSPLTLRLALLPPLFPYTTLFRSLQPWPASFHPDVGSDRPAARAVRDVHRPGALAVAAWQRAPGRVGQVRAGSREGARDRKSTRLNSSHRTIWYAVFCLKKKNKKQ